LNQAPAQREAQRVGRRSEERNSRGSVSRPLKPRVESVGPRVSVRQRDSRRPNLTPQQPLQQRQIRQQQPQRSVEQRSQSPRRPPKAEGQLLKVERKQGRAGEAPGMRGGGPSGKGRAAERREKGKVRGR
jgi:hypothetical protein